MFKSNKWSEYIKTKSIVGLKLLLQLLHSKSHPKAPSCLVVKREAAAGSTEEELKHCSGTD